MGGGWYILEGDNIRPVSVDEWSRWSLERRDEKRIALNQVGDVEVSTVFLGLDHGWGDGPPVVFETMTFGGGEATNEWQWRYTTRAAAQAGHDKVVLALAARTPLGDLELS